MSIQIAFWLMAIPVITIIAVVIHLMIEDKRRDE